jgi:hypothetical protein
MAGMRPVLIACVATLFVGLVAAPARAASIVLNGGFETGDFTGWTVEHAAFGSLITVVGPPYEAAFAGSAFAGPGFGDQLWQELGTNPGDSYLVTFSLRHNNDGCGPALFGDCLLNYFLVNWGAVQPFLIFSRPTFGATQFSFVAPATGPTTRLLFEGADSPGFYRLDDVSVTPVAEPSTLLLIGSGVVAAARRRRVKPYPR